MHLIDALLAFVTHHSGLAYGAVFLVSLGESLALVGLIVPGTVIMFGVGAIVAAGSLDLKPVLLLAAAGAIAGDGFSYWLGRYYRDGLRRIWPFWRYPGMLKKGEIFFHRHGGKSVLLGRFVGPVRPVIPVVAGMLGMRPISFTVVNVLSAVGWAFAYILPGVFFGTSLAVAGAVSTRLAALLFLVLATCWSFVWLARKVASLVGRRGPIWLSAAKGWAVSDRSVPAFMVPIRRLFSYLFQHQHGDEMFIATLVLTLLVAGWGFLWVLEDVLSENPLVLADQSVYHFFQALRTPLADRIFVAITELGDSFVNICLSAAVLVVLLGKRRMRAAGFWATAVLGGLGGVQLMKWLIQSPRPLELYHGISAYGFPSGHTAMSVILYGFLAILAAGGLPVTWRWGLFATVSLISMIIAFSRLYLGAHWLSDVLGGFFMAISWISLLGIAYLKGPDERVPRRLLGLVTVLVVVIAGGWHVTQRHQKDLTFYAPQQHKESMALPTWLAAGWRKLPAWRIDMIGEQEQPLTIQAAGSPADLARYLSTKGWHRPPSLNLKNLLAMLSPDTPIERLPVFPHPHSGRVDYLSLVLPDRERRWVLRLWPSDFEIAGESMPLFVGTIEIQQRRNLAWLITAARDTGEYDRPLEILSQMLQDRFTTEAVRRKSDAAQVDLGDRRVRWRGEVLLIYEKKDLR